jgi:leader peptidase (prepilin peptidase)/N-methyltransferase
VARSAPPARAGALVVAVAALACTLDARVPLTTGIVIAALIPAVLVDLIEHRLPNRLVGGAALIGGAGLVIEVAATDATVGPVDPVLGALAMAGPLLLTHLVRPAAMGFGDVKLAVVLGAALGLVAPVIGLLALAVGSGLSALAGLLRSRRTIAFGPGMLVGAVLALVLVVSPSDPLGLGVRSDPPGGITSPSAPMSSSGGTQP